MLKVVPSEPDERTSMLPPNELTIRYTIARPNPE